MDTGIVALVGAVVFALDFVERGSGCWTRRAQLLVTLVVSADIVLVVVVVASTVVASTAAASTARFNPVSIPLLLTDMVPLLLLVPLESSTRLAALGRPWFSDEPGRSGCLNFDFNSFVWASLFRLLSVSLPLCLTVFGSLGLRALHSFCKLL